MKITKTLKPGQAGTKKWKDRFGDDLVSVRYRYDENNKRKLTTAEIIVDERNLKIKSRAIPANKIVCLRVEYDEIDLRRLVKNAGGRWNKQLKVWELAYREVISLGLECRTVERHAIKNFNGFNGVSEPVAMYCYSQVPIYNHLQ